MSRWLKLRRSVVIEWSMWRCARRTAAGDVIRGKRRHLAFDEVVFTADWLVSDQWEHGRQACELRPAEYDASVVGAGRHQRQSRV